MLCTVVGCMMSVKIVSVGLLLLNRIIIVPAVHTYNVSSNPVLQ